MSWHKPVIFSRKLPVVILLEKSDFLELLTSQSKVDLHGFMLKFDSSVCKPYQEPRRLWEMAAIRS